MFETFKPRNVLLMGPGPSPVSPTVLASLSKRTIGHLDKNFFHMMEEIKVMLRSLFATENDVTFPVSGPGSAGMDTCVANLVEPGDKVIVCINGVFGQRMAESVRKVGGVVLEVHAEWGKPILPSQLREAFEECGDCKLVCFVHAETSTGVRNDAEVLCSIAKEYGSLTLVDTVTSLGGIPVEVDAWGIDAVFSGSQKCLSCPPGLSPVSFSRLAMEKIRSRAAPIPSWFLDVSMVSDYWDNASRSYHHTAPINALYGLHQALIEFHEEGRENVYRRHADVSAELIEGLSLLDLKPLVQDSARLPQLITVTVPSYVNEVELRSKLMEEFGIEIGAGLGDLKGKVVRIGLMGHGATSENVVCLVNALSSIMMGEFVKSSSPSETVV